MSGVVVLGLAVWFVVSLAMCLFVGAVTRLGNRVSRAYENSEERQTGGEVVVVDLDAFPRQPSGRTPED